MRGNPRVKKRQDRRAVQGGVGRSKASHSNNSIDPNHSLLATQIRAVYTP